MDNQPKKNQITLPILEDRHIEILTEQEALTFGTFVKTGILQKIYQAQLKDVEAKLTTSFGFDIEDATLANQVRELQSEHRAVRCSIETLDGLFD